MKKTFTVVTTAVALWVCITSAMGREPEGAPIAESLDMNQLRITWRNMANEQVVFPLQMKNMPVKIGSHRQLFLDNYLIAASENVTRQVHQPRRLAMPVLTRRDRNEEVFVLQVRQFETAPKFRMWYWSWRRWHKLSNDQEIRFATSYATSHDGVHWNVPDLDLYKIAGMADRNVVIPYGLMHGLFYEPHEPDPQKRFKALVCVEAKNPEISEGYYLHTSPDGVHWKADLSRQILPSLRKYDLPQSGIGDTTRFWWDPLRKKYIGDVKFVIPGKLRCRGIMESDDLVHWTRPRPTFFARQERTQIYGHTGFAYQGLYVGTRWIYVPDFNLNTHSMNVELDTSRDGHAWTRVGAGQPFMDFNHQRDTWDASRVKPTALLEVGDEIWIYYAAAPTGEDVKNPEFPDAHRVGYSTGLAKLPRDRFASINGEDEIGTLLTRPLDFQGHRLHVNAAVADNGELRVGILTRDEQSISGYTPADSLPITGDSINLPVSWQAKEKLTNLNHSQVRFQFLLKNAKLFSFWID